MIRYALLCEHDHPFEAWFGSSTDYDLQAAHGQVECPMCFSTAIRKQIMSPAIATSRRRNERGGRAIVRPDAGPPADGTAVDVAPPEETFDYVGDSFAREARDIHEGRSEQRGIYGEASPKEVKALLNDGITVAPLPSAPPAKPRRALN
jgi:hypothetical protein